MRPILIYAANHVLKCLPPRELASKDPNADLTHDRYDDSELLCEIDYNGIMANWCREGLGLLKSAGANHSKLSHRGPITV
jgi:hypothetical protein